MAGESIEFEEFVRLLGTLDSADLGFMHKFSKALAKRDPRDQLLLARLRAINRNTYSTRREWQSALLEIVQRGAIAAERTRTLARERSVKVNWR